LACAICAVRSACRRAVGVQRRGQLAVDLAQRLRGACGVFLGAPGGGRLRFAAALAPPVLRLTRLRLFLLLRHLLVLLRHLCVGTLHQLVDRIDRRVAEVDTAHRLEHRLHRLELLLPFFLERDFGMAVVQGLQRFVVVFGAVQQHAGQFGDRARERGLLAARPLAAQQQQLHLECPVAQGLVLLALQRQHALGVLLREDRRLLLPRRQPGAGLLGLVQQLAKALVLG
jgi:hypothetical protein